VHCVLESFGKTPIHCKASKSLQRVKRLVETQVSQLRKAKGKLKFDLSDHLSKERVKRKLVFLDFSTETYVSFGNRTPVNKLSCSCARLFANFLLISSLSSLVLIITSVTPEIYSAHKSNILQVELALFSS
jgi:hypothetical protein